MNILDSLKDISTEGINKLKDVIHLVNCGVCHKQINKSKDSDVFHVSHLDTWLHNKCTDQLNRCNNCDRLNFHLENGICGTCMNSVSVRGYSYKPDPEFHRVNPKRDKPLLTYNGNSKHGLPILHFGVEIETDFHKNQEEYDNDIILENNGFASLVHMIGSGIPKTNLFYCKTDGSLSDNGIEIVSHPFSWSFWRAYGQEIYDTLFSAVISSGYASAESYEGGMHIHISKGAVKRDQLLKLLWFIYECPTFIKVIAQRDSHYSKVTWESLTGRNPDTFSRKRNLLTPIARKKFSSNAHRYTAVNLQNSETIEFRFFNGTLNIMTLSKAIEFLHSLLSYCSQTSIEKIVNGKSELTRVDDYLKYLALNQTRYTNLCVFLANHSDFGSQLSTQKKNKYFSEATNKLGRAVLNCGLSSDRSSNQFNSDNKGVIV